MLSENDIKEELSYAYVHAVAAKASFACERVFKDRDSIDVTIRAKGKLTDESKLFSPALDLQLKATSSAELREDRLIYDLPMKNYNELREDYPYPRLLVILMLPEDPIEWLSFSEEALITRRCAYWMSLWQSPEVSNSTQKRLEIPTQQVLSPDTLYRLMVMASRKEEIRNEL